METKIKWDEEETNSVNYPAPHDFSLERVIEGVVVDGGKIDFGDRQSEYVVLKTDEDVKETVWLSTVLRTKFSQKNIKMGDYVGIRYLNMVKARSGYRYKNFDVRVVEEKGQWEEVE